MKNVVDSNLYLEIAPFTGSVEELTLVRELLVRFPKCRLTLMTPAIYLTDQFLKTMTSLNAHMELGIFGIEGKSGECEHVDERVAADLAKQLNTGLSESHLLFKPPGGNLSDALEASLFEINISIIKPDGVYQQLDQKLPIQLISASMPLSSIKPDQSILLQASLDAQLQDSLFDTQVFERVCRYLTHFNGVSKPVSNAFQKEDSQNHDSNAAQDYIFGVTTVTIGRPYYLKRAIASLKMKTQIHYLHIVIANGPVDEETQSLLKELEQTPHYEVIRLPENKGVANALNHGLNALEGRVNYWLKLDDDIEVITDNFFETALDIFEAVSTQEKTDDFVISPFPVGLISHLGGIRGEKHLVVYSNPTDAYYTLRFVQHVGGACRIAPWHLVKKFGRYPVLLDGTVGAEDSAFSVNLTKQSVNFVYLENGFIFQEIETRLGQSVRLPEYGERMKQLVNASNTHLTQNPETFSELKKVISHQSGE